MTATLTFAHAGGDIDLYLIRASTGAVVSSSTSSTDNETLSRSGMSAGWYYVVAYPGELIDPENDYAMTVEVTD